MEFIFIEVKDETNTTQRMGEYKQKCSIIKLLHLCQVSRERSGKYMKREV